MVKGAVLGGDIVPIHWNEVLRQQSLHYKPLGRVTIYLAGLLITHLFGGYLDAFLTCYFILDVKNLLCDFNDVFIFVFISCIILRLLTFLH